MQKQILIYFLIASSLLLSACAHQRPAPPISQGQKNPDFSCKEQLQQAKATNLELQQQVDDLKGLESLTLTLKDCRAENQALLDQNIAVLEDNRILLQQISKFKNIIQEKKEIQWKLNKIYEYSLSYLETERLTDQVYVLKTETNIKIVLPQRALFPTARSAWITPKGTQLLTKIAEGIKTMNPGHVEIAGHTDNRQIPENISKIYPTNWDLAMARSMSVLRIFQKASISEDMVHVTSYGQTQPLADNETVDGRAMNRRVEIIVTP